MEQLTVTPGEWNILEVIWQDGPQTLTELVPKLKIKAGWSKSTTATMVRRMIDKNILGYEMQGRGKLLISNVDRNVVVAQETDSLLKRAYYGSVGLMLSAMVQRNSLTKKEIDELYKILKDAEENAK